MKARLIFDIKQTWTFQFGGVASVCMDCYKVAPDEVGFQKAYVLSWIAFDPLNPSKRILMDQHKGRACHLHIDGKHKVLSGRSGQTLRRNSGGQMKTFTLRIEKNPERSVKARLLRAARTGVPDIHPDEMVCGSAHAMTAAFSKSKLEVFAAIVEYRPQNIRELAKILKKDEGNVSRDVKGLELLGIVQLKRDNGRSAHPIAIYDSIKFEFGKTKKAGND